MVKVKICGITDEKEIDFLNELKPDYIGFVFAESKRKVSKEKAEILCSKLCKNIKAVGVFKNQDIFEISDILNKVNLDIIQLHGKEDINYIKKLRNLIKDDIEIWKAVSNDEIENITVLKKQSYSCEYNSKKLINKKLIDKYLIDGANPGSGQEYSLNNMSYIPDDIDYFLAGGITPENVLNKINEVNPFGIDVSSGVEYIDKQGLSKKSYEKIKILMRKAIK